MSRPELTGHASLFYNAREARKYDSSSRMIGIQREITERAVELLRLPDDKPSLVLDIGCGSGLSGQVLEERGHVWLGCDVSRDMLDVANERIERKREAPSEQDDKDSMNDESSRDEGDLPLPSTGDLMHHVSVLFGDLNLLCCSIGTINSLTRCLLNTTDRTGHGNWIAISSRLIRRLHLDLSPAVVVLF